MKYEDCRIKYGVTGNKLIDYGKRMLRINLILAGLILLMGIISSFATKNSYFAVGSLVVSLSLAVLVEVINFILSALGELVINSEIVARNSCESLDKEEPKQIIKPIIHDELPDL